LSETRGASVKELVVQDSKLLFHDGCGSRCVTILGHIKNPTKTAWCRVWFHAEFFDANKELIDAYSIYDSELVIPASSTTSFRLSDTAAREADAYASHTVEIRHACELDD
jgi:hypothetical protein